MFLPRWILCLLDKIQRRSQFFTAPSSYKEHTGLFYIGLVIKVQREPIRFGLIFILSANHRIIRREELEINNISYICRYSVRNKSLSQLPNYNNVEFYIVAIGSNVFHHLTGHTTKPATPKSHQKLEKLHFNILIMA